MPRPTLMDGDVWSEALANAAGYPILDGADEYGHGEKVIDDWLDDSSDQIKARFYSFYNRLKFTVPVSGRVISYSAYSVVLPTGAVSTFSGGTYTLPDSTTGFVYLTPTGNIEASTTLPEVGVHLANFVTASGNITTFSDVRFQVNEVVRPIILPPNNLLAVGDIKLSARTTPESGWLLCNGASYTNSEYPALASAIGNTYNLPGDAPGTFRVPDMSSRVAAGVGSSGFTLGAKLGALSNTLNISQMPRHSHVLTQSPHTHAVNQVPHGHAVQDSGHSHIATAAPHRHGVNDPGHSHPLRTLRSANLQNNLVGTEGAELSQTGGGPILPTFNSGTNISIRNETVQVNISTQSTGVLVSDSTVNMSLGATTVPLTIGETGGASSFSITQPTTVLNYFIRAF